MAQLPEWFSRLDFSAMEDAPNKLAECEFFFSLASQETDRAKFRWLVSAFFNAAYSYFEMSALRAHFAFTTETGDPLEDRVALNVLKEYVGVERSSKKSGYVKTLGRHPITKKLYDLRRRNTHHFPLSIMVTGTDLPEDFHFGHMQGEGASGLSFCRDVLSLIHQVQSKISL